MVCSLADRCTAAQSQYSKRSGARDRLGTRADRQLREDPLDVRLHRLRRNLEGPRDAFIGKTLADHAKDIALPRRERIADLGLPGAAGRVAEIPARKQASHKRKEFAIR